MSRESDLSFFVAVARARSLTAAARELAVSPPAVSKRLSLLEDRLGVRLLHRTTRRVALTHEGEVYLEQARRIMSEIDAMEHAVASRRGTPRGLLRVNAPLGFGRTHLAPAISDFAREYPEVAVELTLTDRPIVAADESLDVGIRFGDIPDRRVVARRIAPNRRLVCASPLYLRRYGRPETPADLARHRCLVLRQNETAYGTWRFIRRGRHHSVKVRGPLSSNDGEVVLKWALDGHGVLMRAEWDIAKYLRSGRLELLLTDYALPPADIYAVCDERQHRSAKVTAFVEFLAARFAAHRNGAGQPTGW